VVATSACFHCHHVLVGLLRLLASATRSFLWSTGFLCAHTQAVLTVLLVCLLLLLLCVWCCRDLTSTSHSSHSSRRAAATQKNARCRCSNDAGSSSGSGLLLTRLGLIWGVCGVIIYVGTRTGWGLTQLISVAHTWHATCSAELASAYATATV